MLAQVGSCCVYNNPKIMWHMHCNQCDHMAKLSFQYWANNNNENLSNVIKIWPIRFRIFLL